MSVFKKLRSTFGRPSRRSSKVDLHGQVDAIAKTQCVVEFDLDGNILNANRNFCELSGYALRLLKGSHHRMLVPADERHGTRYRSFWEKLARGEFDAGTYKRVARDGRELWLRASYNPLLDMYGRPFKVVKYAIDVTEQTIATRTLQRAVTGLSEALAKSGDQARDANDIAVDATSIAVQGERVIDQVVERMDQMRRGAQSISDVVNVIEDIAFQTNLLALNAALEAAWAGESGRGLALIASEVRVLAQRSAESAKQVRSLIGVNDVYDGEGAALVAQASATMSDIVHSVERVTGKMDEIRTTSRESTYDLDAIHEAVARLEVAARKRS